jgi:hypothetical protein
MTGPSSVWCCSESPGGDLTTAGPVDLGCGAVREPLADLGDRDAGSDNLDLLLAPGALAIVLNPESPDMLIHPALAAIHKAADLGDVQTALAELFEASQLTRCRLATPHQVGSRSCPIGPCGTR